jgi:hypothetical protein
LGDDDDNNNNDDEDASPARSVLPLLPVAANAKATPGTIRRTQEAIEVAIQDRFIFVDGMLFFWIILGCGTGVMPSDCCLAGRVFDTAGRG